MKVKNPLTRILLLETDIEFTEDILKFYLIKIINKLYKPSENIIDKFLFNVED
jgi:hypothetical protein